MGVVLVGAVIVAAALVTVALFVGMGGVVSAQSGTTINSCTTINNSGSYTLGSDLSVSGNDTCIQIAAGSVTLDGAGHTISGSGDSKGIVANGSAGARRSVTVENVETTDHLIGIYYLRSDNGRITDTVVSDTISGISLAYGNDVTIDNNTATSNSLGIALAADSTNNTIRDNVATGNKWGIHFERRGDNNTVVDNAAWGNSNWDFYSTREAGNNPTRNLTMASARVDLEVRNTGVRGVDSPPASPDGQRSLGRYLQLVHTNGPSKTISLSVHYGNNTTETPALWAYQNGSWSELENQNVDRSNRTVSVSSTPSGHDYVLGVFVPGQSQGQATSISEPLPTVNTRLTTAAAPTTAATTGQATTATTASAITQPTITQQATAQPATTAPPVTETTVEQTTTEQATTAPATGTTTTETTATETTTAEATTSSGAAGSVSGTTSAGTTDGSGPGFGIVLAVLAVLCGGLLGLRRR